MTNLNLKLNLLARDWGHTEPEALIEEYIFDGVMPGICQNQGCDYSTEYEPDQDAGWCECCGTNTVVSAAVLMGII
jgi:hypothetical protein